MKPSLKDGLPYGWWKNRDLYINVTSTITLLAFGGFVGFVVAAWFTGGPPR